MWLSGKTQSIVWPESTLCASANGHGVRGEIVVAEHHATRAAGGAGGVEDRGEYVGGWGLGT